MFSILTFIFFFTECKKTENPIKFPQGTFPDTVKTITDINTVYDDYNLALYQIYSNLPIIFSSNRKSSGGQFDLEQASISFLFDQTKGTFILGAEMTNDIFFDKLINKAKTPGNDFGPYRFYSALDGFEYLLLSSVNAGGNLDFYYLKNRPVFGSSLPDVDGPYPVKLLNTNSNEAYICFDQNLDTAYFSSDKDGNFDIFMKKRPIDMELPTWFSLDYSVSNSIDSINSPADDKCPMVLKNVMIFTSDRPGGIGGFDLYYSIFRNGKWNSPVNLGPDINTSFDEYRPVIGSHPDFTNLFMMFSSNRPGGKGGFDLYFTGIEFPEK
jgi:hypothetical protein